MSRLSKEFKNSLEAVGSGIACIDSNNHKVLFINSALEELSLYTKESAENLLFQNLFLPTDYNRVSDLFYLNSLANGKILNDNEFFLKRKSGRLCNVSLSSKKIKENDLLLVTVTDNTPRKELESELQEIYSQMIQTSKFASLAEMAAGIAHEINNPLAIIHGVADQLSMLLKLNRLTDEKIQKSTKTLKDTVMRATKIIDSLKALSRNDSKDPKQAELLSDIINNAFELNAQKLKYQNVNITIENNFEEAQALCNPAQLLQVFLNLFDNSIFALKDSDKPWIKICVDAKDDQIILKFIDSGLGIKREHIEKIMNPFFTTKPVGEGTGLGLSLSKNIINRHDGHLILLTNTQNTTFEISLPSHRKSIHDEDLDSKRRITNE